MIIQACRHVAVAFRMVRGEPKSNPCRDETCHHRKEKQQSQQSRALIVKSLLEPWPIQHREMPKRFLTLLFFAQIIVCFGDKVGTLNRQQNTTGKKR